MFGANLIPNLDHPLNQGLKSWYLDLPSTHGGGRFIDLVGGYHGKIIGQGANSGWRSIATTGGNGSWKGDGTAGYIEAPMPFTRGAPLTLMCWFKLAANPASGVDYVFHACGQKASNEEFWIGYLNASGTLILRMVQRGSGTSNYFFTAVTLDTKWHHLVCVFSAATVMTMYLDGVPITGSQSNPGGAPTPGTPDTAWIGGLIEGGTTTYGFANGYVDDCRILTRSYTAQDAVNYYQLSKVGYSGLLIPPNLNPRKSSVSFSLGTQAVATWGAGQRSGRNLPLYPNLNHPLNQGRIAWLNVLPRTYGGGRLIDLIGQNHGKLIGNSAAKGFSPITCPGGYGSIQFDGTNIVDLGTNPVLNFTGSFTIAFWAKYTVSGGFFLCRTTGSGTNGYDIIDGLNVTGAPGIRCNSVSGVNTSLGYNDGKWHRILCSIDPSGAGRVYVDGFGPTHAVSAGIGPPTSNTSASFQLGGRAGVASYTGLMADIGVWNSLFQPDPAQDYYASLNYLNAGVLFGNNKWWSASQSTATIGAMFARMQGITYSYAPPTGIGASQARMQATLLADAKPTGIGTAQARMQGVSITDTKPTGIGAISAKLQAQTNTSAKSLGIANLSTRMQSVLIARSGVTAIGQMLGIMQEQSIMRAGPTGLAALHAMNVVSTLMKGSPTGLGEMSAREQATAILWGYLVGRAPAATAISVIGASIVTLWNGQQLITTISPFNAGPGVEGIEQEGIDTITVIGTQQVITTN